MARGKGERRCRTSNFKWKLQFSLGIPRLQSPPFCLQASLPRPPSIPFAGDFRQSGSLLWRPASWSHPPRRDTGQRDSDSRLQLRTNERTQRIASPPAPPLPPRSGPPEPTLITEPGPFLRLPPSPRAPHRGSCARPLSAEEGKRLPAGPQPCQGPCARPLGTQPDAHYNPATAKLGHPHS